MADLPEYRRRTLVDTIGVVRAGDDGSGLMRLGGVAAQAARELGADAYRERVAAEEAYLANMSSDSRARATEIAAESGHDPEKFQEVYGTGYVAGTMEQVPEHLKTRAEAELRRIGSTVYTGLLTQKYQRDRQLQDDALTSAAEGYRSEWMGLAAAGKGADPRAIEARARFVDTMNGRVAGQFVSRDHADRVIADSDAEARGQTYLAFNQETYKRKGFAAAWGELDDLSKDENIPLPTRTKLVNRGQEWLREQQSLADRADAQARRQLELQHEETGKAGWSLYADGKLSGDWVERNRTKLSLAEYKALQRAARGGADVDDPEAFADVQRALYGSNPAEAERLAYQYQADGRLKNETLSSTLSRAREFGRKEGPKSEYERTRGYIVGSLDPGPMVPDPAARARLSQALDMYDREVIKKREKPLEDADVAQLGRDIVQRFQLVDWSSMSATLPLPKFFVGTRAAPNIEATEAAIAKAVRDGAMSREDAEFEARIIERWRAALAKRPPEPRKK